MPHFLHTDYLCTSSLSPSLKLHCIAMTTIFTQNDHFFKSDQIDRKRLICSAFNQNGQVWKKWSFWVKIVVIAMQRNAILMKVTSLMRIDPCLSLVVLLKKKCYNFFSSNILMILPGMFIFSWEVHEMLMHFSTQGKIT